MTRDAERIDLTLAGGEGFVLVQPQRGQVRIVVSLAEAGEFDISLARDEAEQLVAAVSRALEADV